MTCNATSKPLQFCMEKAKLMENAAAWLKGFHPPWCRRILVVAILGGVFWQSVAVLAQAPASPPIRVELNKLEPLSGTGCRVYIVTVNPDPEPIEQLRLDLILFDTDGVIARRVALDLGPLAAHKTAVRLFDLQNLRCDGIGRALVNDVLACQSGQQKGVPSDQQRQACLGRLQLSSRAKTELVK